MRCFRSEGWIPIKFSGAPFAVVLVMKREPGHFKNKLELLEQYQAFIQAFYNLAAATDDRLDNIKLLREVAGVLTRFAEAPGRDAFCRALCALLTSQKGFR